MERDNTSLYCVLVGRTVQLTFAVLVGIWLIFQTGWVPDSLYALLIPLWVPSYLAFAVASGLRNTIAPWLGSGFLFDVTTLVLTYIEAILVAGFYRLARDAYRTYRRERDDANQTTS